MEALRGLGEAAEEEPWAGFHRSAVDVLDGGRGRSRFPNAAAVFVAGRLGAVSLRRTQPPAGTVDAFAGWRKDKYGTYAVDLGAGEVLRNYWAEPVGCIVVNGDASRLHLTAWEEAGEDFMQELCAGTEQAARLWPFPRSQGADPLAAAAALPGCVTGVLGPRAAANCAARFACRDYPVGLRVVADSAARAYLVATLVAAWGCAVRESEAVSIPKEED